MAPKKKEKAPAKAKKAIAKKSKAKSTELAEISPEEVSGIKGVLDGLLDEGLGKIRKNLGLSGSSFDPDEPRLHTGLLSLDVLIGGGIVSGGWYTLYGGEQSAKTTLAMTIKAALINQKFEGRASYWDYEGCLVADTKLVTPDGPITIQDLVDKYGAYEEGEYDTPGLQLQSVGQIGNNQKLFVKKDRPITKIETESTHLRGFQHPILVKNDKEQLEWRKIEELTVGDFIVVDTNSEVLCNA